MHYYQKFRCCGHPTEYKWTFPNTPKLWFRYWDEWCHTYTKKVWHKMKLSGKSWAGFSSRFKSVLGEKGKETGLAFILVSEWVGWGVLYALFELPTRLYRLPGWLAVEESACQWRSCRRPGFSLWVGKTTGERKTHLRILAWRLPWTQEPGGLQSMELQRIRHH